MMHGAGEAVGREPFRERIRLEECAIDFSGLVARTRCRRTALGMVVFLYKATDKCPKTT
jgi:hypothetical protein